MKITSWAAGFCCILSAPLLHSQALPDFDQFPHVILSNGRVEMKVFLPDREKGLYRATRFDWSGVIGSVQYKGHEYFGYWKDTHDPCFHEDLMGPVEGYIEPGPGYEEAAPGGRFIRIGVGVLKKEDEPEYNWRKTYEILDHGTWETENGKEWIRFTHTLESDIGYSYRYTKTVRLKEDGFLLEHSLENTGTKLIETDQFNHNFFMIDGEPSGPAFRISFPFRPETGDDPKGFAQISGNDLVFLREIRDDAFFLLLEGYSQDPEDHRVTVVNQETGAGVTFSVDKPLYRMAFWACETTLSPENSVWLSVRPGEKESWTSDYTLFTQIGSPSLPVFLEGTWKSENSAVYEHWDLLNDRTMKGISYGFSKGIPRVIEYLEIGKRNGSLVYTATVPGQNQGQSIGFPLTRSDPAYEFNNPEHDFPQTIRYTPASENRVSVFAGTGEKGIRTTLEKVDRLSPEATSRVDTMPSGELLLVQEIAVEQPVGRIWKAFTDPEEWSRWVAPVVEMDFRVGGTIRSHYNPQANIGDEGTIVIHIPHYLPMQQITMQAELAESFPEFVRDQEEHLYSVFRFDPVDSGTTRVTVYGIGYRNESRWNELIRFFIRGNEMTLNNLKKYLESP